MATTFKLTPLNPINDKQSSSSTSSSTLRRSDTLSTTAHRPACSSDLSKTVLSFILSPAAYKLLRIDFSVLDKKLKFRTKVKDSALQHRRRGRDEGILTTLADKSFIWLSSSLMDPMEYAQWFKSQERLPCKESKSIATIRSRYLQGLSSATRSGIRGFALAFVAGTLLDVILPALLRRHFSGIVRSIATNTSARSLACAVGSFALVYKIVFHHALLLVEKVLAVVGARDREDKDALRLSTSQQQNSRWSRRSDSGVDLDVGASSVRYNSSNNTSDDNDNDDGDDSGGGSRKNNRWIPAAIATLVAAPAFALIPQQSRRLMLAMYFVTYAGEVSFAVLEQAGYMDWMPSWCGSWMAIPLSISYGVHTFIHHTECTSVGFHKLIMSQCSPYLVRPLQYSTATYGPYPLPKDLFPGIIASLSVSSPTSTMTTLLTATLPPSGACEGVLQVTQGMAHGTLACRLFHPHTASCTEAMASLLNRNMRWATQLYGTLAIIAFVVRGGSVFQYGVLNYFKRAAVQTTKSVILSSGIMFTAFPMLCALDRYLPKDLLVTRRHYLNGFFGGLWVLGEAPKRRSALALYYMRFAIECWWRRMVKAGYVRNIKHGETLLMGVSMAVIMGVFETMPKLQPKSFVQSSLSKIFVD